MEGCRNLVAYVRAIGSDVNGDGIFTITDLLAAMWHLLVLPSKIYVFFLEAMTGEFFELTCTSHEAVGWVLVSVVFWIIMLGPLLGWIVGLFRREDTI